MEQETKGIEATSFSAGYIQGWNDAIQKIKEILQEKETK